jgi:hypothetical protein
VNNYEVLLLQIHLSSIETSQGVAASGVEDLGGVAVIIPLPFSKTSQGVAA